MLHYYVLRTSIEISDNLFIQAKKLAAEQRSSLRSLVEDGLRLILAQKRGPNPAREQQRELPVCDAGKPHPGIDLDDTSALLEVE